MRTSRRAGAERLRRLLLGVAILTLGFAIYGSLLPFRFEAMSIQSAWEEFRSTQSWPWEGRGRIDFAVNVLLLVPAGFGLAGARGVHWRQPIGAVGGLVLTLVACGGVSLGVEMAQTCIPGRVGSASDAAAQLMGAMCGWTLWMLGGTALERWWQHLQESGRPGTKLGYALRGYLVVLAVISWIPFDLTIHPGDLVEKYRSGRIGIGVQIETGLTADELFDLGGTALLFFPVGTLALTWGRRTAPFRRSISGAFAVGSGFVLLIEAGQLFVFSRFTEISDVLAGATGVLAGAAMGSPLLQRFDRGEGHGESTGRWFWLGLCGAYAILPICTMWWPFEFTTDAELIQRRLEGLWSLPFSSLEQASPMSGLSQLIERVLLYAPLGALLGAAFLPAEDAESSGWYWLRVAAVILMLAASIEAGQIFVPSRYPDVTDVLLATAGGLCGATVPRLLSSRGSSTADWGLTRTPPTSTK